jgi:hypothetical protein
MMGDTIMIAASVVVFLLVFAGAVWIRKAIEEYEDDTGHR